MDVEHIQDQFHTDQKKGIKFANQRTSYPEETRQNKKFSRSSSPISLLIKEK